ncbi:small subunit rRNA maturation protein TSR1 [Ascoidea rubescens DSM 1968]|uniref:DUF663-domain-containing protein n=1 Tax=Ascoidea rubescens DSM 1968 TaxID=1344418 RepID=A0A1D2VKM5_9ASCO|nr:DUF663-domain-containing protein [Ascoidea rubescens DSM 1968]ODV62161.1 DUF663-domain-containing protein [Ascoidea rubescens DSM 1968]
MGQHHHRATLKKSKKPFKSRHSSKSALKAQLKGKIETVKSSSSSTGKTVSKTARINLLKQQKKFKILSSVSSKNVFQGIDGVEKIVTIITLTNDLRNIDIINQLIDTINTNESATKKIDHISSPISSIYIPRFKSGLKIILPVMSSFFDVLDACKISDWVVFGLSAKEEVDKAFGENLIRALELQGISNVISVIPNIFSSDNNPKQSALIKSSLFSYFNHFFPNEQKIFDLNNSSDSLNVVRILCEKKLQSVKWRQIRGYLLANEIDWIQDPNNPNKGKLAISGTVRGIGFNVDRLVHLPNFGDYSIESIYVTSKNPKKENQVVKPIFPTENKDSLETLNENFDQDMFDNEMTKSEPASNYNLLANNDSGVRIDDHVYFEEEKTQKVRVRPGTSDYQARWFLEDDYSSEELDEEIAEIGGNLQLKNMLENNKDIDLEVDDNDFESMDMDEDNEVDDYNAVEEYRKIQELEFDDQLQVEPSVSLKERLKKYRGIINLNSYNWLVDEVDENRPSEWLKLLRIYNFKATQNRVLKESGISSSVKNGDKVVIHIKFPKSLLATIRPSSQAPFIVYGLLEHEHKSAVCNFTFKSWEEYEKPIKSESSMVVQYGFRRQIIEPVFSVHNNTPNNVHKVEKFANLGSLEVATCIAPVSFGNSPSIFFKLKDKNDFSSIELIGSGTFLNVDHSRVLAKRTILTGQPFKIHKSVSTVRYMFLNSADVNWFKSIPLFTKNGVSGFIQESLGTHGHFKAKFNKKVSQQDTVAMALYKRIWPKNSSIFKTC